METLTKDNWKTTWSAEWCEDRASKEELITWCEKNHEMVLREIDHRHGLKNFTDWPTVEGNYTDTLQFYIAMVQSFKKNGHVLNDKEYWEQVSESWRLFKHPEMHHSYFNKLFFAGRPNREKYIMTFNSKELYDSLPNVVTIYRGCWKGCEDGLSYSLRPEVATYFAFRGIGFPRGHRIITAEVKKKDIIMVCDADLEQEVIATKVKVLDIAEVSQKELKQPLYTSLKVEWNNKTAAHKAGVYVG